LATDRLSTFSIAPSWSSGLPRRVADVRLRYPRIRVSERTLDRGLAEITAQGAPILAEAGVGYVLREGTFRPPLMLSTAETEAVVLGLKYVTQFGGDVLKAAARDAAAKIASVLSLAARETPQEPISLPDPRAKSSF
jgi:predicted DNA-binding transcriptional regulator YafY